MIPVTMPSPQTSPTRGEGAKSLRSSDVLLQLPANRRVIRHVTADHPPEVDAVVPHLDVAELMDDHVVKTGLRSLDQIEVEGDPPGQVGIASPARFHGADRYGRQRDSFYL